MEQRPGVPIVDDDRLQTFTSVRVVATRPRSPFHRVTVEVSGRRMQAWLLRSVDGDKGSNRDTLVFTEPEIILEHLPSVLKTNWERFCSDLRRLKRQWRFHGVPTLKKAIRLYRNKDVLSEYNLTTVCHHYGAVPALLVGKTTDGHRIALLHERFGSDHTSLNDVETLEVLGSLEEMLPQLFLAYFEQVAYYFEAIFFGASPEEIIRFCLRIRQILVRSIREKCLLIQGCSERFPQSRKYAQQLRERNEHAAWLREGEAIDAFGHLLVNYIYRFCCLRDRVDEYQDRVHKLPSSTHLIFGEDRVRLMQESAQNIREPRDEFLGHVLQKRESLDDWLFKLTRIAAFVAELSRFSKTRPIDSPRVFVTYHFRVKESEDFFARMHELEKKDGSLQLLRGRELARDIRSSLLARIWFSDHQVMFVPPSWAQDNGLPKELAARSAGRVSSCRRACLWRRSAVRAPSRRACEGNLKMASRMGGRLEPSLVAWDAR
jgi:hypothetical protein